MEDTTHIHQVLLVALGLLVFLQACGHQGSTGLVGTTHQDRLWA